MSPFRLIFFIFIFSSLLSNKTYHDYYVSVTKIEYAEEQKSLQIISQIFIDDFEKVLQERYDKGLKIAPDDNPKLIDDYISKYLSLKLKIKVNGKDTNFVFIGKEYKDDMARCYLEIENISDIRSIEVTNRALFDVIPAQQNIVRLKLLDKNKSFLLLPENDKCVLNFN